MTDPTGCIAIVGMAGRFPGADDVDALWSNLRRGVDSIAQLSDHELIAAGVARALLTDARYVKARGVLTGVELFDADFFAMSAREAELTDPQHRLLLECAWHALENAGVDPERAHYPIGVFAGTGSDGYLRHHLAPSGIHVDGLEGLEAQLGNEREFSSTRIAYKLNLRGPCLTVQTACSTSLVAVQLACQSLLSYQCDLALAGGVSIAFPLHHGYLHQPGHILSPDGRCRAFDAAGQGPVAGDGAGLVVLKRLEDALADRDHIHAVILAAAVNNDGSLKPGYAAPSVHGQAEVVALTHAIAGVSARSIGYVEAHGTGTPLGDPIEVAALTQAFAGSTSDKGFCALGSLKPNLGHLNTAAGIASLIKASCALSEGEIPPSLHYTKPNPQIDFAQTPFFVNDLLRPWPSTADQPVRRAGVSAFGIGGTNAHVLLEQAPQLPPDAPPRRRAQLLVLSARCPAALHTLGLRLATHLEQRATWTAAELADVAYTLQIGRRALSHRRAFVCEDAAQAIAALRAATPGGATTLEGSEQLEGLNRAANATLLELGASGEAASSGAPLLARLGELWCQGAKIDWSLLHGDEARRRRPLPGYPFQRVRHWVEAPTAQRLAREQPLEQIEAELQHRLAIRPLDSYPGLAQELLALCAAHVLSYLRGAGVAPNPGVSISVRAMRDELAVLPKFHRLFDAMLAILCEQGWISREADTVRFLRAASASEDPAVLQRAFAQRHEQFSGLAEFLAHCAQSYREALSGRIPAISVLYPGGSSELVARFAQRTAEHRSERVYLSLLTEAIAQLRSARGAQPLRILEIGGGQGMLTWPLLSALRRTDGGPLNYHFTDLGRTFVDEARREAKQRGFDQVMSFGVLDIAREPADQAEPVTEAYDVVVGYNVVHAVRHVPSALANLRKLLVPGGTLGLVEVARIAPWDVLTWGLAEGFWHFEDELRTDSALLSVTAWEEALRSAGFENVLGHPRRSADRARIDHGLLLAERSATILSAPHASPDRSALSPRPRPALRTPYSPPSSELERRIGELCQELFGLERVGMHDDFFELGADSLVTLRLADLIRTKLGLEVPEQAAFQGATVAKLAGALTPARVRTDAASPLVAIQTGGERPPLFFVHPVIGVAFGYVGLARALGADQPFYAFQSLGLNGRNQPDPRIEDTGARYVEAMRAVAPHGPYYLGGYSFGCSVAFEMAQQLTRSGERVALLALVDGPAPISRNRPTLKGLLELISLDNFRDLLPHLHDYLYLNHARKQRDAASGGGLSQVLARAMIASLLPPDSQLLKLQQPALLPMARQVLHHFRQARGYAPPPYPGRVALFRALEERSTGSLAGDGNLGWEELALGGVERHEIAANHFNLLSEPRVRLLAERLAQSLRDANQAVEPPPRTSQAELRQRTNGEKSVWTRFSSMV